MGVLQSALLVALGCQTFGHRAPQSSLPQSEDVRGTTTAQVDREPSSLNMPAMYREPVRSQIIPAQYIVPSAAGLKSTAAAPFDPLPRPPRPVGTSDRFANVEASEPTIEPEAVSAVPVPSAMSNESCATCRSPNSGPNALRTQRPSGRILGVSQYNPAINSIARPHPQWDLLHADRCADIPPGAIPRPLGSYACEWQRAQMDRAEIDDFVIYDHEWLDGGTKLGPFGQRHLTKLVPRLAMCPLPLIVARSQNMPLDEARRAALIEILLAQGFSDADQRVSIGYPLAWGLTGREAPNLSNGYYRSGSGTSSGAGYGSSGSFGGGLGTSGLGGIR